MNKKTISPLERPLTLDDLKKMKPGQQILGDLFGSDCVMAMACKMRECKYPITHKDGKRFRSLGIVNEECKYISAEEEGCSPDAMETQYSFIGMGSLEIRDSDAEDCIKSFKLRIINTDHPKYSKALATEGCMFNSAMKTMSKMFGKD